MQRQEGGLMEEEEQRLEQGVYSERSLDKAPTWRKTTLFLLEHVFSKTPLLWGDLYIYKTQSHSSSLGNTGRPAGQPV